MRVDGGIVAYFAPGGGLGHLNRALAICLGLRDAGVDGRIVTNSPFAAGLAGLARCPVVELGGEDWGAAARSFVREVRPRAVVMDTFPYGLRGEFAEFEVGAPVVHVARRLLRPFRFERRDFACVIQVEPLAEEHCLVLGESVVLDGPVLLAPGRVATAVPRELRADGLTLVVHSGAAGEVAELVGLAGPGCVVISPWSGVEYYPATNLYERAGRVFTGAGYNSMADLLGLRDKHVAVAFGRKYDDQAARVRSFFSEPRDGTGQAVGAILSVL